MKCLFTILIICFVSALYSQEFRTEITDEFNVLPFEELAEADETTTAEDDDNLQQLLSYKRYPLNINGPVESLNEFPLFDALLINNLIQYRLLLGSLISIYELQAVPGFSIHFIRQIIPYITINDNTINLQSFSERLHKGAHTIIMRSAFVPERAEGFIKNDNRTNLFTGGRPSAFFRYKYQYRNLLQYGITGDKDPGEPFFSGRGQLFMNFSSFHFFARNAGWIKSLAIGDYTVNLGQGLTHWQSQAFKISSGITNIKRQSETLRPHQSAGEFNFHRGVAVTLKRGNFESTAFISSRKLSANIGHHEVYGKVITSISTSGLHRSQNEIQDRNSTGLLTYGGNFKWLPQWGHIGFNFVKYKYSLPIQKREEPYNLFAIKGNDWINGSLDYSFTFQNFHFFGEFAVDKKKNPGAVVGMMGSLDATTDMAILYRNIGKAYQSVYGNAFTENTLPANENGLYSGISVRPKQQWKLDIYADIFSFPWLKYRVDAPSRGVQYLLQVAWKPSRGVEIYSRYRHRMKPLNIDADQEIDFWENQNIRNWRTQISYQVSTSITLRNRAEICFYASQPDAQAETGYLFFTDLIYKPLGRWYSGNFRIQHFETGSYNTRVYAYENDLLLVSNIPSFSGLGTRFYMNIKAKSNLKLLRTNDIILSLKIASTIYNNQNSIGSGMSTIHGKHKSDIRFQIIITPDM